METNDYYKPENLMFGIYSWPAFYIHGKGKSESSVFSGIATAIIMLMAKEPLFRKVMLMAIQLFEERQSEIIEAVNDGMTRRYPDGTRATINITPKP